MHLPVYKHIAGKIHPNLIVGRRLGSGRGTLYAFVLSEFFIRAYLCIAYINPFSYV